MMPVSMSRVSGYSEPMADILHYPGDRTRYDANQILGPDLFGAHYRIIGAEYDKALDRTTMALQAFAREDVSNFRTS